jgi:3-methyladenine DNA glycosylase AlkD
MLPIQKDLRNLSNPEKIPLYQSFFKTGKGEYAEGDIFIGLTVPNTRKIAIKYKDLPLKTVEELMKSKIHEERLCALLILVHIFKTNPEKREEIYNFYLKNTKYINNWDLVDLSAPNIPGNYLFDKDKSILYKLVKSQNLWERRISILSTFAFIKNNEFTDSLKLAEILLHDKHDLIHKAVGWMLREIGKRDLKVLETFLQKHYKYMPRTMLRYSIEKFPENKRKKYLLGKI